VLVGIDVVNAMAAYQPVVQTCGSHCELREPKHAGASIIILNCFKISVIL